MEAEDIEIEDEYIIGVILSNLFRKESNGEAIYFFLRRTRLDGQNNLDHKFMFTKLKEQIEKCGGHLEEEPYGCHSIELVFSEEISNVDGIDSDLFKSEYIEECIKCGDLLDLEKFRLGKSPYGSININMIMKGYETWDSVSRINPGKGRKLPDFGFPLQKSQEKFESNKHEKKSRRVEYSIEEDLAILKFLLANNLCDKVGGNTTWKIVHRTFPDHSYQSLHNRFRRFILPNLHKYEGLTSSERKLFNRASSRDNSQASSPEKTIETENDGAPSYSVRQKNHSTNETVVSVEDNAINIALPSGKELTAINDDPKEMGIEAESEKKPVSSSIMEKTLQLKIIEDIDKEENTPMSQSENLPMIETILSNLFQKELNGGGGPIEFYMSQTRFCHDKKNVEIEGKCSQLKERIKKYGGNFGETPHSCHSIELVFPEAINDIDEIDSDVFKAEYVDECIKCGDLLDLENFRLGKSPYDGSININNIMKGNESWKSLTKSTLKSKKLPCHAEEISDSESSNVVSMPTARRVASAPVIIDESSLSSIEDLETVKLSRVRKNDKICTEEFTVEKDQCILEYIILHKRYSDISGKKLWIDIQASLFKNTVRDWKSIKLRFQDVILKDLECKEYALKEQVIRKFRSNNELPSSSELESDFDEAASSVKKQKFAPRLYTHKEDHLIVSYIVKKGRYEEVRGKNLWVDIENKVLHGYNRSWESAKNRFLRSIFKNLDKFDLSADVIEKFKLGAVVERHLGGRYHDRRRATSDANRKKTNVVEKESSDEARPTHPALAMKEIPTPSKKQKRQLFSQPIIPLPIEFSPSQSVHSTVQKKIGSPIDGMKTCKNKEGSATEADKINLNEGASNLTVLPRKPVAEAVSALLTTTTVCETESTSNCFLIPQPLRSAPSIRCFVVLKRLTQNDLEKIGCKAILTTKKSSTHAESSPMVPPVTLPPKTPSTTSRFTVEISPCLLAARLSAAGSSRSHLSSARQNETGVIPLTPSRESTRKKNQLSARSNDDTDEVSSPEASPEIFPFSAADAEADFITDVDSALRINARNLPFQTKIPIQSFARLVKDDQSSDGYHTPEG